MATPALVDLIKDKYVTFGSKTWDKTKVSTANLLAAVRANPRLLIDGWTVNSSGQIIRTPIAPVNDKGPVTGIKQPSPAPASPASPSTPATAAPVAPVRPAIPTLAQFGSYQDANYWLDLDSIRQKLGLVKQADGSIVSQSAQAKLAQLGQRIDPTTLKASTGGVGGKTLYDILYAQQQQNDARAISLARSEAARRGVLRSGYNDRTLTDLAGQSAGAYDQLVRNYGTDLNDSRSAAYQATQGQADLLQQYQQAQGNLALAASQRGYENALNQYQQTYGGY